MTALIVGTVLALGALAYVLYPLFFPSRETAQAPQPPGAIARDLSSDDAIEAAVAAYRKQQRDCPTCGPRPERDAIFCSSCGHKLTA